MLVLLIIFMVVAPTLLDGFRAEPPRAVNVKDHPLDSTDVVLGIVTAIDIARNNGVVLVAMITQQPALVRP